MSIKSAVAASAPGSRGRYPTTTSRRRPSGHADGTGARRRRGLRAARCRDARIPRVEPDEFHPDTGNDHEIDPAFDEVGDLDLQIDALFAHRRLGASRDRSAQDDGPDFE